MGELVNWLMGSEGCLNPPILQSSNSPINPFAYHQFTFPPIHPFRRPSTNYSALHRGSPATGEVANP